MTREEYNALKGFAETLISTLKEKIAAADATAYDAEKKRNEYDDMKKLEKQQYNTTAQTTTDPNSIITAYNTTRANEEVRVDGNQT